jgi:hypothetical protein
MANSKGHPGNKHAAKGGSGKNVNTYLSLRDVAYVQRALRDRGEDPERWIEFAHRWAKNGIYREIKDYMDAEII